MEAGPGLRGKLAHGDIHIPESEARWLASSPRDDGVPFTGDVTSITDDGVHVTGGGVSVSGQGWTAGVILGLCVYLCGREGSSESGGELGEGKVEGEGQGQGQGEGVYAHLGVYSDAKHAVEGYVSVFHPLIRLRDTYRGNR
jgi:hypothetical protein